MKERPILFSGLMVRALLEGRKTQTRRIIKPQPKPAKNGAVLLPYGKTETIAMFETDLADYLNCPYGKPGDLLWVKETWAAPSHLDRLKPVLIPDGVPISYEVAKGSPIPDLGRRRPSIFMRRWMSRIILEVVGVRVERLQDISEHDAWQEGIGREGKPLEAFFNLCMAFPKTDLGRLAADDMTLFQFGDNRKLPTDYEKVVGTSGRGCYAYLWESINGPGSWAANPFVWVIEFRRIKP